VVGEIGGTISFMAAITHCRWPIRCDLSGACRWRLPPHARAGLVSASRRLAAMAPIAVASSAFSSSFAQRLSIHAIFVVGADIGGVLLAARSCDQADTGKYRASLFVTLLMTIMVTIPAPIILFPLGLDAGRRNALILLRGRGIHAAAINA